MNEQKLKNLIELVTFDQSLSELQQRINTSNTMINSLQSQLQHMDKQLEQQASKQKDVEKQLHEQELKVKELQDKEAHLNELSNAVATSKEFEAANKQTDQVKFDRNQQEQRMMQMLNRIAAVKKEFETVQAHHATESVKLLELISQENDTIKQAEEQLKTLQKAREEKTANIPVEWLNTYETMRGRVQNPVVPALQDSCSACFYFMSARDMQTLREQGLLQCKDCFRFLYQEQTL